MTHWNVISNIKKYGIENTVPHVSPSTQSGGDLLQSNTRSFQFSPVLTASSNINEERNEEKFLYSSIIFPLVISLKRKTAKTENMK